MYSHDHNLHIALMIIDVMLELPDVGLAADTQLLAVYKQTFIATVLLCIRWEEGKGNEARAPTRSCMLDMI